MPLPNNRIFSKFLSDSDESLSDIEKRTLAKELDNYEYVNTLTKEEIDLVALKVIYTLVDNTYDGSVVLSRAFLTPSCIAALIVHRVAHIFEMFAKERLSMVGIFDNTRLGVGMAALKSFLISNIEKDIEEFTLDIALIFAHYCLSNSITKVAIRNEKTLESILIIEKKYNFAFLKERLGKLVDQDFNRLFNINKEYSNLSIEDQLKPIVTLLGQDLLKGIQSGELDKFPFEKKLNGFINAIKVLGTITGETVERKEIQVTTNQVYQQLIAETRTMDVEEFKSAVTKMDNNDDSE